MNHYLINFVNNQTEKTIRHDIKFEGDLQTAKKFSMNIAKRLKIADCSIYIFDQIGYYTGGKALAKLHYRRPNHKPTKE